MRTGERKNELFDCQLCTFHASQWRNAKFEEYQNRKKYKRDNETGRATLDVE